MRKTLLTKKAEKRGKVTPKLTSTVTAACLLFGSFTNIFAQTAFDSNLKTVSISDAARTNLPPTAKLKYIKESDTFSFDASGSFDSDGYIKEYKWDLGDGTKATGITVSHKYADTALPVVTLTAVDNSQNVTILQQKISMCNSNTTNISYIATSAYTPDIFTDVGFLSRICG